MSSLLLLLAASVPVSVDAGAESQTIETIAGTGRSEINLFSGSALEVNINQPFGVEVGPDGGLYICEVGNHRVLRLDLATLQISTVAGNGKKGYSGDGGKAVDASLNEPYEVRFDRMGSMYSVEMMNAVVRKVDLETRKISTIAGTGRPGFSGDGGPATQAELKQPHSIALDSRGLYIADIGNHRIRRVDLASGRIETVAGNGEAKMPEAGSVATARPIFGPRALFITEDTLWIALREGHSIWRMDLSSRRIEHVAGTGKAGLSDGARKTSAFHGPKGIAAGGRDDIFVADTENQVIRRIETASGTVSTVAGSGPEARGFGGEGGPALEARLDRPHGITMDRKTGILYIGDTNNHRIRRVRFGVR